MTRTLRNRLTLLGTTSLFALALVAAPVQFNSLAPDLAVAQAAGPPLPDDLPEGETTGEGGAGGHDANGGGGGRDDDSGGGGSAGGQGGSDGTDSSDGASDAGRG